MRGLCSGAKGVASLAHSVAPDTRPTKRETRDGPRGLEASVTGRITPTFNVRYKMIDKAFPLRITLRSAGCVLDYAYSFLSTRAWRRVFVFSTQCLVRHQN